MRENIHITRKHWCSAWTSKYLSFNAHTTQRSESINSVIERMGTLDNWSAFDLFMALKSLIDSQDMKRLHKDNEQSKIKRHRMEMFNNCTQFAHSIATLHIAMDLIISATAVNGNDTDYIVTETSSMHTAEYSVSVTSTAVSCSCNFPAQWLLPCRHVTEANKRVFNSGFVLHKFIPSSRRVNC